MEVARRLEWFPAPGKLNLFLHVLGRRADGMHELQTVFRLIEHGDEVGIRVRQHGVVRRVEPVAEIAEAADLCVQAARKLQSASGVLLGADLGLRKVLPIGGGLGGGSSDAATVLLVLNRLWRTGYSRKELMALAQTLGADVPLFVHGENALGEGIGERLTPLALPPRWYAVLVPNVRVSTAAVFADNALTRNTKALKIPPFFFGLGGNDLEPLVARRHPEIAAHLEWLRARQAGARLTGSGAGGVGEFAQAGGERR